MLLVSFYGETPILANAALAVKGPVLLHLHVVLCQAVDVMDKKTISDVMREIGRKGWSKGGKRSLKTMTPEERTARAKKAAAASATVRSQRKRKP